VGSLNVTGSIVSSGQSVCLADGTNCPSSGITSETDPIAGAKIGTLTSGQWCTSDGSRINCTTAAPGGITSETDPTVPANVKDGVTWSDIVSSAPAGFADGVDNVGTQSGSLTNGKWCTSDGVLINCTSDPPTGPFEAVYAP
jgi:hypothetical protein